MAIRSKFPDDIEAVVGPVGRVVARTGVSANVLTTFGLLLTGAATWAVANGHPILAAGLLIAGGLMDLLDGAVARATSRATPFGGFYDSVSDRVSDGMILGGIAWWLSEQPRLFVLAIVALVAAEVTSYVRARAEAIDLSCTIGILERAERAVLLMAGLLFYPWLLEPVLWVLAVGSVVTVVQRVHHVWCQIDRDIPDELLALALADRAWSRAFKGAARRFYGERNFDGAVGELNLGAAQEGDGRAPADRGRAARRHDAASTIGRGPVGDSDPTPGDAAPSVDGHPVGESEGSPSGSPAPAPREGDDPSEPDTADPSGGTRRDVRGGRRR